MTAGIHSRCEKNPAEPEFTWIANNDAHSYQEINLSVCTENSVNKIFYAVANLSGKNRVRTHIDKAGVLI